MKSALVFLAVLSVAFGAVVPKAEPLTLPEAFAQFGEIIDFEAIQTEVAAWIEKDSEVAAVYDYFSSDNFEAGWVAISNVTEIVEVVRWVESTGVDIIGLLNRLAERFDLPPFEAKPTPVQARTWASFTEAILALYPQEEVQALIKSLNDDGGEFAELFQKINALRPVFLQIEASEIAQTIGADLRALGVDVDRLIEALKQAFGWE